MDDNEWIRQQLGAFFDDLWIRRRLALAEPINLLEEAGRHSAANLQGLISDWLRFLRFLDSECSGREFASDKQWSELMNLMHISRKLNHRSAKFKDIIKNKHLIESNELAIKRLNEAARLGARNERALNELDTIVDQFMLEIPISSLNSVNSSSCLDSLTATRDDLDGKCKPLLYTLRVGIEDELNTIGGGAGLAFDSWRQRLRKHESTIDKLTDMLGNLCELESRLYNLAPLVTVSSSISTESGTNNRYGSAGKLRMEDSIGKCRQDFGEVQEYHARLIDSLQKLSMKRLTTQSQKKNPSNLIRLPLVKLLDSHGRFVSPELGQIGEVVSKLHQCRRELDDIMRTLRLEFGRFYFVNDLELLTIIALDWQLALQSNEVSRNLLTKLFNNAICSFVLDSSHGHIVGVENPTGELVMFSANEGPVEVRKPVNLYSFEIIRILNAIVRKIRRSLKSLLFTSLERAAIDASVSIDWSLPIQMMNLSEYIKFCRRVESDLGEGKSNGDNKLFDDTIKVYEAKLKELSAMNVTNNNEENLTKLKKSAAISLVVHFLSLLMALKSANVSKASDWHWIKQVRYYTSKRDDQPFEVIAEIGDIEFIYKFDYLQVETNELELNSSKRGAPRQSSSFKRLISTQTTERCFLVASQAVGNFRLGASPQGPAGSGKTESIKALGQLLGCQVIVHNCDESNDSESLERLIWGLAHTGLWGCFDEFNRLSVSVLSQVSATLEQVQTSIGRKDRTVEMANGEMMCVDKDSAFFITLNPIEVTQIGQTTVTTKKYRGRRHLPANLRQLFVPIAIFQVQIDAIVSESLLSMHPNDQMLGPSESLALGSRISKWLDWMRSNAPGARCEWDLRLVMAILRRLKSNVQEPDYQTIDQRLYRAIDSEVRPRLNSNEVVSLQNGLKLNDLHTTQQISNNQSTPCNLRSRIKDRFAEMKLECNVNIEQKIVDLMAQLETHVGVLLHGPTGTGKSCTWRMLQAVMAPTIAWFPLNPKCCPRSSFFGFIEMSTGKWIDGPLTDRLRSALNMLSSQVELNQVWLVIDGPIDPDWVESLNSVLDDNQVLTLSSGERLHLTPAPNKSVKLLLETDNISLASPATISRLGAVLHEKSPNVCHAKNIFDESTTDTQVLGNALEWLESDARALIVSGRQQKKQQGFVQELMKENNSSYEIIEYYCSPHSTCHHLMDLIAPAINSTKTRYLFVLSNVHLIEPEQDQWQVKSFLELVRFIATYGLVYKPDANMGLVVRKLEHVKFLLLAYSINCIDHRTLSQARVIQLTGAKENETPKAIKLEHMLQEVDSASRIVTISCDCRGTSRRTKLIEYLTCNDEWQVYEFCNSILAKHSIEALANLEAPQQGTTKKRSLFILSNMECRLMDHACKSRLFHLLNCLAGAKLSLCKARLFYLTHKINQDAGEQTFWTSLGQVLEVEDAPIGSVKQILSNKLGVTNSLVQQEHVHWLANRVDKLIESERIDSSNKRHVDAYLNLLIDLIWRSSSEFQSQRRTLYSGLERLSEFEQSVERIRLKCSKQEEEMIVKESEIATLIGSINVALDRGKEQRARMADLKAEQELKNREIQVKSGRVETELKQVQRMVDSSKGEIAKCLKPEALNEIRALRSPPQTIKDILDALFLLLSMNDFSWSSMKSYLANGARLRDELTGYDFRDRLNPSLLSKVDALIQSKSNSFQRQQATRASKAIVPILDWIHATVEYGQVLTRLRPLDEEMDELRRESAAIDKSASEVEQKLQSYDHEIQQNTDQLEKLKQDYSESKRMSERIKLHLKQAESVRADLQEQVDRWQSKLGSLDALLNGDQLVKFGAILATAAAFNDMFTLEYLTEFFDAQKMDRERFVGQLWQVVCTAKSTGAGSIESLQDEMCVIKPDEAQRIFQLLVVRVCLDYCTTIPPFLDLGSSRHLDEEVAQYLGYKSVLFDVGSDGADTCVSVIKCNELNKWRQSIELQLRLNQNKLVLVEVPSQQSTVHLDILDFMLATLSSQRLNNSASAANRIILVGQLAKLDESMTHMLRTIKLSMGGGDSSDWRSCDEIKSAIMDHMIQLHDPESSAAAQKLERQVRMRQREAKSIEFSLLQKLATVSKQDAEGDLHEDVVQVLSRLQKVSKELALDKSQLDDKMAELHRKRDRYAALAGEAAQFYLQNLSNLGKIDKFYHMSLSKYMGLLAAGQDLREVGGAAKIDYKLIVDSATRSMRPDFRLEFERKLGEHFKAHNKEYEQQGSNSGLRGAIQSQVDEITGMSSSSAARLMVVLHDPTKSSPLLEVDEFFSPHRQQQQQQQVARGNRLIYSKFYATSDPKQSSRLESALIKILRNHSNITCQEPQCETAARCLCIANAHLSANWINSRLLQLLTDAETAARVLVILIGESGGGGAGNGCEGSPSVESFDSNLLEFAQVKYWHDELALNLCARISLLTRSLFANNQELSSSSPLADDSTLSVMANNSTNEPELCRLARQLVLFHVVCQELTKPTAGGERPRDVSGWRNHSYTFDYNQLCLAFKTLSRLHSATTQATGTNSGRSVARSGRKVDGSLRSLFCYHLESIIYGSRMETLADEQMLSELIERFIRNGESAEKELERADRAAIKLRAGNLSEHEQIIGDLLCCACETACSASC